MTILKDNLLVCIKLSSSSCLEPWPHPGKGTLSMPDQTGRETLYGEEIRVQRLIFVRSVTYNYLCQMESSFFSCFIIETVLINKK